MTIVVKGCQREFGACFASSCTNNISTTQLSFDITITLKTLSLYNMKIRLSSNHHSFFFFFFFFFYI